MSIVAKSGTNLEFDLISDGEFKHRVTHGLLVEKVGDDVRVYVGRGDMEMVFGAITALAEFAIRMGYGQEMLKFIKENKIGND